MAIKAGQILHDANGFTVDRIQSGGVSNLNIPEEKIYELGNYETVATVRDVADLSFDLESLDTSTEIEALILGRDPGAVTDGTALDLDEALPMDVVSPFKTSGAFSIVKGVAIPYLTLESATYRFGVRQNSTQSFSFRGDGIYYIPGAPVYEEFTLVDNTLSYNLTNTALVYNEGGDQIYILSACVKNETNNTYKRLFLGTHFTNTATAITLLEDFFDEDYDTLHVVYGTAAAISYPQDGNNPLGNVVHEGVSVKPAAVRGKDIDVYIMNPALATPILQRWSGVQSFEVTRRVNLEADEEFGNYHYVAQDYDTADVTGSITVKPADVDDLFDKIRQVADISATDEIIGAYSSIPLEMELRINDPDTGDRIKTLYVEDARFLIPSIQGQVQQKQQVTFTWTSDGGNLVVYKGERA